MVKELLSKGKQNAITANVLCSLLDVKPRVLTRMISLERQAGAPICASSDALCNGYYLAANKEELEHYCDRLRHRAGEIFKTRKACLDTLEKWDS